MIIRSLQAENLLKYRRLRLDELPEQGVIGVSGDNESGKSAIGEIICFALFGRTNSLAANDLRKLVRWGAIQGYVALRFGAKDRELEIVRHLERGGEQSARLLVCDQSSEPMARGVQAVNEQMERLLGCDYEEFIDTFYLAQREITTPHSHSPSVKAMAGIVPLERCAAELCSENEQNAESVVLLERKDAEMAGELARLSPERSRVDDIEQELARRSDQETQLARRIAALSAAVAGYCNAQTGLRSHVFRRGLAGSAQVVTILLLLAAVGLWAFLLFQPQLWPLPTIREHLEGQAAALGLPLEPALGYAVFVLAGALVLTWLWTFALNLGSRGRRARARQLGEELRMVDELEPMQRRIEPELAVAHPQDAGAGAQEQDPALAPDAERRARLAGSVLALEAGPDEVRAAAGHEIAWMERKREALAGRRETLTRTLASASLDREREQELMRERKKLSDRLADGRRRIATEQLACELLRGALRLMTDRFNEHLRILVSRNLPRFTNGRYEYLQVTDDLGVRVYSNEKRGFLALEEISTGTQRQIMLALRLALAQEKMSRIGKDRQFVFLDEPFAFFDDTRMRGALRLLPQLSDLITQQWVVAQRFPRDEFLALEIPCGKHPDTLEIGMAQPSRRLS